MHTKHPIPQMLPEASLCAICETPITEQADNDTNEHILLQALGGRRCVRGFICRPCNSHAGETWDLVLSRAMQLPALGHGVKRQRGGEISPLEVFVDGKKNMLGGDGVMRPTASFRRDKLTGEYEIVAGDLATAKRMERDFLKSQKMSPVQSDFEHVRANHFFQHKYTLSLDKIEISKSAVKSALAMAHYLGISYQQCEEAVAHLRAPGGRVCHGPTYLDLISNRPTTHLLHCVAVRADPKTAMITAYVEYFGLLRILVLLGSGYQGELIEGSYTINPATGLELNLPANLDLPKHEIEFSLKQALLNAPEYVKPSIERLEFILRRQRSTSLLSELDFQAGILAKKMGISLKENSVNEIMQHVDSSQTEEVSVALSKALKPYLIASVNAEMARRGLKLPPPPGCAGDTDEFDEDDPYKGNKP